MLRTGNDQPAWAPDGNQLVLSRNSAAASDLVLIDDRGAAIRVLTHTDRYTNGRSSWSPRGDWIAFESNRTGEHYLYLIRPDGSDLQEIGGGSKPAWSPDGKRLTISNTTGMGWQISLIDPDGSNRRRLTNQWRRNGDPSWSPDGEWIVFASNRDGNSEIYRVKSR